MLHHTRGSVCAAIAAVAIFLTGLTLGNAQQPDAGGYRSYRSPSRENEFGGAGSRSFVQDTSRTPQSGRYRYADVNRNPYSSIRPGTNSANNAGYRSGYQSADRRSANLQNTFRNRAQNFGNPGGNNQRSGLTVRQRMKMLKTGRRTRSADRAATDTGIDRSTTAYSGFDDRGRYDGRRRDARQLRSPSSTRRSPRTQQFSPAQTVRALDLLQQRRMSQRVNGNRRFDDFPPASNRRFDDFPPASNRRFDDFPPASIRRSYAETELVSERGDGFRRRIPPDWQRSGSQNGQRDFADRTTGYGRNDFTEVDRFSEVDRRPFETAEPQFQRQPTQSNRFPRPYSSEDQYRQGRPTGDRLRTQQRWTSGIVRPVSHETPDGLTDPLESETAAPFGNRIYLSNPEGESQGTPTVWERWEQRMSPGGVALQRMVFTATTLAGGRDKLGMFDFNAEASVIFPRHPGITIKPGFQALFPDGPTRTDLPPRLYSARLEFQLQFPVTQTIGAEVAVIPSLYGDFENLNSDSIRILGRVLGFYKSSPQTRWVLGLIYLDRDDVPFLPAFGMISTPRDDLRLELVFPRPKLMKRISRGAHNERWIYLMGEFGGDSWAVIRANGARDQVNYKDWRLIFGFEQKYINGRSLLVETGYVFQRELEYVKGPGDFDPGETWMFRAGMVY